MNNKPCNANFKEDVLINRDLNGSIGVRKVIMTEESDGIV